VFDHPGISNGPAEAINLPMKKIKRAGHGFRNLDKYRLRRPNFRPKTRPTCQAAHQVWL